MARGRATRPAPLSFPGWARATYASPCNALLPVAMNADATQVKSVDVR